MSPSEIVRFPLNKTHLLIILCEVNRDKEDNTKKRTDFYGIRLVQDLRRNKFKGKVLFTSLADRKTLTKPEFSIINTIGHRLNRPTENLSLWQSELDQIQTLDDIELYDIDVNYCNKYGLAQQELHALHGIVHDNSFSQNFRQAQIKKSVSNIGLLYNSPVEDFINGLDFGNLSIAVQSAENFCNQIISKEDKTHFSKSNIDKKPWSILVLDDEVTDKHRLVMGLKERVENVYCVNSAEKAKKLLETKIASGEKISLVISDYRLEQKEGNLKVHQPIQGYRFLMNISKSYPYIALAALSAMPRKFLLQSFKKMGIRVDVYSKKDYFATSTTRNILIEELIEKGDENFETIVRLPRISSPKWVNFESFYSYHRRSIDYYSNETYISNKARSYCEEYKKGDGKFAISLKNYNTELAGTNKSPEKPKYFAEFLEKMVCRRAVIWYARYGSNLNIDSPEEILKFLKGENFTGTESKNDSKNKINTNLALRLRDFPWNMTIEEKNWLIYEMGVDSTRLENLEQQENDILTFSEEKITSQFKNLYPYPPNTFLRCKKWIKKVLEQEKPENHVEDFEKLSDVCSAISNQVWQKQTVDWNTVRTSQGPIFAFLKFLKAILNKTRILKKALKDDLTYSTLNDKRVKIIDKARRKYSKDIEIIESIETEAIIFLEQATEDIRKLPVTKLFKVFDEYLKVNSSDVNRQYAQRGIDSIKYRLAFEEENNLPIGFNPTFMFSPSLKFVDDITKIKIENYFTIALKRVGLVASEDDNIAVLSCQEYPHHKSLVSETPIIIPVGKSFEHQRNLLGKIEKVHTVDDLLFTFVPYLPDDDK